MWSMLTFIYEQYVKITAQIVSLITVIFRGCLIKLHYHLLFDEVCLMKSFLPTTMTTLVNVFLLLSY